jgi:uncharacterized Ntn-hydrolase superfamily protein
MTFSLIGRCVRTHMFGAVVTTSSIAVGSRCPFVRARVGAALTQHRTDPRLGPLALDLLAKGFTPQQAMDAIVAATPHREWRQLAIIDAEGRTASFSGERVKPEKNEAHGRDCVALGNIVRSREVPAVMVRALQAGDEAGGEFKPLVSAALLVADSEAFPFVDLRVDGDGAPIAALARLWQEYAPMAEPYLARALDPDSAQAL